MDPGRGDGEGEDEAARAMEVSAGFEARVDLNGN
jgi:hypothetical protein